MISDVEYFDSKMSKIDGFGDLGEHLIKLVKAKPVALPPATETNNTSAISSPIPPAASSPRLDQATGLNDNQVGEKPEKAGEKESEKEPDKKPEAETGKQAESEEHS